MKRILIITEHPAPYWDNTFNELNKYSILTVIYIKSNVASKPWNANNYYPGIIFNYKNALIILKGIYHSNQIILGGIYLNKLLVLFAISILLFKKVALFSDVPEEKYRSPFLIMFKKFLYKFFNFFLVSGYKGIEIFKSVYNINENRLIYFPYAWDENRGSIQDFHKRPLRVFISNRFLERKGYDILLQACYYLVKENIMTEFVFNIAGTGSLFQKYKSEFNSLNTNNFNFLGWLEYDDYINELNSSHIFIHTSKFEPFGIPVLDALYRGKIVVSSNMVMSASDYIEDKKNGFIFSAGDYMQLANILKRIAMDNYDLNTVSSNAKRTLPNYSTFVNKLFKKID